MQYHFDGLHPGDPDLQPPADGVTAVSDRVDVLIVGCGPAGLTLAAQLSAFPDIVTRIVDRKPGPLKIGQADGVACRSIEMFAAFGFAERVVREAYWVNEVAFWRPDATGALHRADRIQDVEDDLSEMPHVILSQARIHDFYLDVMASSPRKLTPDYSLQLTGLSRTDDEAYPLCARFAGLNGADDTEIHARYVVGCDGARSAVRQALGYRLKGEAARQLWGVMDVLAVTDFPDIRLKCAIQSDGHGSLLIIPREGGALVRVYIELDALQGDERAADRGVTAALLEQKAREILAPYRFEVRDVAWCSAYEIGQRVCDSFDDRGSPLAGPDDAPRVFIAGDACHTHSPKAGQGMNVSMADAFNLGWKLASVLRGQARPALLKTYSDERRAKAQELIDFDRDLAALFSSRKTDPAFAARFQDYFQQHARYTAGVATRYDPSNIVMRDCQQDLARGFVVGMRFHSAPVIRLGDARPLQLGHILRADGRWRLIGFAPAGDRGTEDGAIARLCQALATDPDSPITQFTPPGADIDSVIDLRAVFQTGHRDMRVEALPPLLLPAKGRFGLTDYEKVFCPDPGSDLFDRRGIDRTSGALVLIRPDQFVAGVVALQDWRRIAGFLDGVLCPCPR